MMEGIQNIMTVVACDDVEPTGKHEAKPISHLLAVLVDLIAFGFEDGPVLDL